MGEVYRARDARLERDVAIKTLSASAIGGDDARARVLREARAAAGLTQGLLVGLADLNPKVDCPRKIPLPQCRFVFGAHPAAE